MKTIWTAFSILAVLLNAIVPSPLYAARVEVTPFIGYAGGGAFRDAESGALFEIGENRNFGIALDFEQTSDSRVELYYSRQRTQLRTGGGLFISEPLFGLDVHYLHLGGTYEYDEGRIIPFAVGTFGATHLDPGVESLHAVTKISVGLGGGVKLMVTDHAAMRLEGRWFGTFVDGAGALFCADGACRVAATGDVISQFVVNAGVTLAF